MDRLIHTALNSISNLRDQRVTSAQNLANMNVPGFRRDLSNEGHAFTLMMDQALPARAMQLEKGAHSFSHKVGFLDKTGAALDIAIADQGFLYVQPQTGGEPALSRRGDLRVNDQGFLVNGAGDAMLDDNLQPINMPPFRSLTVNDAGGVSIEPLDGEAGVEQTIAQLASVIPEDIVLRKGADGHIRLEDGNVPPPDLRARILQGVLEGSNVNPTEELIGSIDLQRSFEISLRMVTTAEEMDQAGTRLLRMPDS